MSEETETVAEYSDRDIIQSIEKGLAILRSFSAESPTFTLVEMARHVDQNRASVRRMLLTLQTLGYVASDGKNYRLTPKVLDLGYSHVSSAGLAGIVTPHLERLNERIQEACSAGTLSEGELVYVARAQSRRLITAVTGVGARLPALATAMGRVLLAGLDDETVRRHIQRHQVTPYTHFTITDPTALLEEIQTVRLQGYAIADQELEVGFRAASVPVRSASGGWGMAINIGMHGSRVSVEQARDELVPQLRETASAIERELAMHPMPFT